MAGLQHNDGDFAGLEASELNEKKFGSSDDHIVSETASHDLDGVHDGLELATPEEMATLRRVPDDVPWSAYRTYQQRVCSHVAKLNFLISIQ